MRGCTISRLSRASIESILSTRWRYGNGLGRFCCCPDMAYVLYRTFNAFAYRYERNICGIGSVTDARDSASFAFANATSYRRFDGSLTVACYGVSRYTLRFNERRRRVGATQGLNLQETPSQLPEFLAKVKMQNAAVRQTIWLCAFALSLLLMLPHGIVRTPVKWPVPMFPKSEGPSPGIVVPPPPNQPEHLPPVIRVPATAPLS